MIGRMLLGLPPLVPTAPRFLLLGSFPSSASLARGEYYAFPRNQLWALLSAVFGARLPETYQEKRALLESFGIAVWDVVASCERAGSLDQAIRAALPNPIPALLAAQPGIGRIVLNGAKAADLFARFFGAAELRGAAVLPRVVRVPSSSPVPSARFRTAADKLPAWRAAFDG